MSTDLNWWEYAISLAIFLFLSYRGHVRENSKKEVDNFLNDAKDIFKLQLNNLTQRGVIFFVLRGIQRGLRPANVYYKLLSFSNSRRMFLSDILPLLAFCKFFKVASWHSFKIISLICLGICRNSIKLMPQRSWTLQSLKCLIRVYTGPSSCNPSTLLTSLNAKGRDSSSRFAVLKISAYVSCMSRSVAKPRATIPLAI